MEERFTISEGVPLALAEEEFALGGASLCFDVILELVDEGVILSLPLKVQDAFVLFKLLLSFQKWSWSLRLGYHWLMIGAPVVVSNVT